MNEHRDPPVLRDPDGALHDLAIQYAMGTLEARERLSFEERLAASPALRRLVGSYSELARELALLVPEEPPPPGLWPRIAAAIARTGAARSAGANQPARSNQPARLNQSGSIQPWKRWRTDEDAAPGEFQFGAEAAFHPTAIGGIETRRLALDALHDRVTLEIRMAPGTSYPAHRHGGVEECYVLEGDLAVGEVTMRAGDYQRVEAGSVHPAQSTRGGCRLLIVSSLRDELLESGA